MSPSRELARYRDEQTRGSLGSCVVAPMNGRATVSQQAAGLLSKANKTGAKGDSSRLVRLCPIADETRSRISPPSSVPSGFTLDSSQLVSSPSSFRSRYRSTRRNLIPRGRGWGPSRLKLAFASGFLHVVFPVLCSPFFPVQSQSTELPATTEEE